MPAGTQNEELSGGVRWLDSLHLYFLKREQVLKLGTIDVKGDSTLYLHVHVSTQIYKWQLWWHLYIFPLVNWKQISTPLCKSHVLSNKML